ncbi:unnamed protein product [Coregonus sp. 'balchen']|nr:unnamed protein product [Coregonus sp. 'balchen']
MSLIEGLLQTSSTVTLLGAVLFLLVLYLRSSGSSAEEQGKEPPGPRPLPLLGNMLQLDLKEPYHTLCEFANKYGSIFTVHFGPKKVVVLAGYKTVKQALVNQAEDFGDRDITPVFYDFKQGHGILFANGDSWKEMRRFALTNLRDFGMGDKGSEDKILEEIPYLIEVFEKHDGKAFDTAQPVIYAVSNIAIVYGSRFEYTDPLFTGMADRANESIHLAGSASIQPLVEDRKNLPYADAVIHETHRLANIAPMAIPHTTSQDVTFQGYIIKKGTSVIPLLTSVLQDDSEWESPHTFNPSHFLDEQGRFVKRDTFMAFSAGRRVCLGEGLARMELFLFFTSLLQHFSFSPPPGVTEDDLDLTPLLGFTLNPSPHQLCAVSRV